MKIRILSFIFFCTYVLCASSNIIYENIKLDSLNNYADLDGLSKFDRLFYKIVFTTLTSADSLHINNSILDKFISRYNKKQMFFYELYKYKTTGNVNLLKKIYFMYPDYLTDKEVYYLFKRYKNNKKIVSSIFRRVFFYNKNRTIKYKISKLISNNYNLAVRVGNRERLISILFRSKSTKMAYRLCAKFPQSKKLYYLGGLYHGDRAIKYYLKNLNKFGTFKPYAIKKIAKLYRSKGKYKKSLFYYKILAEKYSKHKLGSSALWYLGWHYELLDSLTLAKKYYNRLWSLKKRKSEDGLFRLGLMSYLEHDYLIAVSLWEKLSNSPKRDFWIAKAYEQADIFTRSRYYYNKAIKDGSMLNYYSLISSTKLNKKIYLDKKKILFKKINAEDNFLFKVLTEKLLVKLYGKVENRMDMAKVAAKNHKYWFSNKLIYPLKFKKYYTDSSLSSDFFRLVFPKLYNIGDSKLLFLSYAIAKQESRFYKNAYSPVGAIGVMQLMPHTAKSIIKALNLKFSVDSLYKINYNIKVGFNLIEILNKKYSGNFLDIICAYNAGGSRVKRWRKRFEKYEDKDLYTELIEYKETRDYFRKVYRNFILYNLIYNYI